MRALTREEIAAEHERDRAASERACSASMNHERQDTVLNQARVCEGRVLVGGDGPTAELLVGGLAGLGVGHITLLDDRQYRSLQRGPLSVPRSSPRGSMTMAECMAATAQELYPEGECQASTRPSFDGLACILEAEPNHGLRRAARQRGIPYIGIDGGGREVRVVHDGPEESIPEGTNNAEPSFLTGGIGAAVALDWVRRILAPDASDLVLEAGDRFYHSLRDKPEDGRSGGRYFPSRMRLDDKRALVVGAGATGTYVALQAAAAGFGRVDIVDADSIERHNLNRQILYYGKDGEPKAATLLARVQGFTRIAGVPYEMMLDEGNIDQLIADHDVVFSCVDKKAPRRLLNDHATVWGRDGRGYVLVDGGTNAFAGQVAAYTPGKGPCIACRRDISGEDRVGESCADRAEPSVIIPNMLVGSLMVAEAIYALANNKAEPAVFDYDSRTCRLYRIADRDPDCSCGGETYA